MLERYAAPAVVAPACRCTLILSDPHLSLQLSSSGELSPCAGEGSGSGERRACTTKPFRCNAIIVYACSTYAAKVMNHPATLRLQYHADSLTVYTLHTLHTLTPHPYTLHLHPHTLTSTLKPCPPYIPPPHTHTPSHPSPHTHPHTPHSSTRCSSSTRWSVRAASPREPPTRPADSARCCSSTRTSWTRLASARRDWRGSSRCQCSKGGREGGRDIKIVNTHSVCGVFPCL